jgi:hypothetical protein
MPTIISIKTKNPHPLPKCPSLDAQPPSEHPFFPENNVIDTELWWNRHVTRWQKVLGHEWDSYGDANSTAIAQKIKIKNIQRIIENIKINKLRRNSKFKFE